LVRLKRGLNKIMSRHNKVNKTNYVQAGRLTPDDMARERKKQGQARVEEISAHAERNRTRPGQRNTTAGRATPPARTEQVRGRSRSPRKQTETESDES